MIPLQKGYTGKPHHWGDTMTKWVMYSCVMLVLCAASASALDGTVLATTEDGVVTVDMATGTMTTIVDRSDWGTSWKDPGWFRGPCFSPDGKRISFTAHDFYGPNTTRRWIIYIADNDGNNIDSICETDTKDYMHMPAWMSWCDNGYLYWSEDNDKMYRASVTQKQLEVVATLADFTGPVPERINNLKMSRDATQAGFMVNGQGSGTVANMTTMVAQAFPSGCQSTVSPNGELATNSLTSGEGWGLHQLAYIRSTADLSIVHRVTVLGYATPGEAGSDRFVSLRFSHSSNNHIVYSGEDALDGRGFVANILTNEHWEAGQCTPGDFWAGTLPPPPAAAPRIALDSSSLSFESVDGATPPSKVVTVENVGAGTLTAVTVQGAPSWLTIQGSGDGNTQTLTNSVDITGLTPGIYPATISVSGGGASNSVTYDVTLNVATTLLAPSNLNATRANDSSATLSWTDNSDSETGFAVERAIEDGPWAGLTTVGADVTTHTDTGLQQGTMYHYRVRAFAGTDSSGWSNEDSLEIAVVRTITVMSPAAGDHWTVGDTVHIRWTTENVSLVDIQYSVDDGEHLHMVTDSSVQDDQPEWGDYVWTVPDVQGDSILIVIQEYSNPGVSDWSDNIALLRSAARLSRDRGAHHANGLTQMTRGHSGAVHVTFIVDNTARVRLDIRALDGRTVASGRLAVAAGTHEVALGGGVPPGLYVVTMQTHDGFRHTRSAVVHPGGGVR
ncbi:MAG: hypothetical protein GF331_00270 [Chitinivibrionales bacterium]|nr:hypothetical protein [Chitinivibrionales bacterium]